MVDRQVLDRHGGGEPHELRLEIPVLHVPGPGELPLWLVLGRLLCRREVGRVDEDERGTVGPPHQLLPETEGDLLDDLVGQPIHVLEVGATGEIGETRDEAEQRAVRPVGHTVLRDRFVGSPGDEGMEAERGRSTAGLFLDHPGEPELFVGGEARRRGAERVREELEPLGTGSGSVRRRVTSSWLPRYISATLATFPFRRAF